MGHIFFWSWPDNIYYGIDAIIITATLTYVDRLESRFFIQGGCLFLHGYLDASFISFYLNFNSDFIKHELSTSWPLLLKKEKLTHLPRGGSLRMDSYQIDKSPTIPLS